MARRSARGQSGVFYSDPNSKKKVQYLGTTNTDKMPKKSNSDPISSPKKILSPRTSTAVRVAPTRRVSLPDIMPVQAKSAVVPLPPSCKTNSKVLLPSDNSTVSSNSNHQLELKQRVFDRGDGIVQSDDVEVASQDVEMEFKDDKDNHAKDIDHPVSGVVEGKVVYGNMEAFMNLLERNTSLLNSEDETGIFMKKDYWFLDSDCRREVLRQKVLGRGSYGVVELYCHNNTELVKKQVKGDLQVNEVLMTATLDNAYIIRTHGLTFRQRTATILMENWGKSLLNYARTRKFEETEIWDLTFQGLNGLEYLDQFGIRHHDIKPENLLMIERSGKFLLKLADFGAAKWSTEQNDLEGWTPEYLSPERGWMVLLKKFDQLIPRGNEEQAITGKSDVYSLGLTMCFPYQKSHVLLKLMTDGRNRAELEDLNALKLKMIINNVENPNLAIENIPETVGLEMRKLLTMMMYGDVEHRFSAGEAKKYMYKLSEEAETAGENELKPGFELININPQDMVQIVYPLHDGPTEVMTDEPEVQITGPAMPLELEAQVVAQSTEELVQTGETDNQENVEITPETQVVVMEQGTEVPLNTQPEHIEPLYMIATRIESVNIQSPQLNSGYPIFRNTSSKIISQETPVYQVSVKSNNLTSPKKVLIPCFTASGVTQSIVRSGVLASHLGLNRSSGLAGESSSKVTLEKFDTGAPTPSSILAQNQDWTNHCDKVSMRNVDELPESLKSRMIKRKLKNKLPAAKKQKIQTEVKAVQSRGGSRRTSREVADPVSAVENIPSFGSKQAVETVSGDGNIPNLAFLID